MHENLRSELPAHFTFSQSSLQDYFDCPRRFQLRYLERLVWPAVETEPVSENELRQQEGQLFHRMVQQHLVGLPVEKLSRLARTPDLLHWWKNYLGYDFDLIEEIKYSELALTAPIGTHRLLAKYDLITISPDQKATIFDWKTSHNRPRDGWMAARMQTRIYRALLVQAGSSLNGGAPFRPEHIQMIYWYAEFPTMQALFPYNTAQYKRDWDTLTVMIDEIAHLRQFSMTDDEKKCAYCTFRSYCSRGRQAGSMAENEYDTEAVSSEFNLNYEQIAEIEF
jgi:CRISPR/Cas system-associated exonuclease Cas4 (RecB family)